MTVPSVAISLCPHIERAGFHTERFDSVLDGKVVCTSRSGWNDLARALLALGYGPETLLRVCHEGKSLDPTVAPRPIGELAKWTWAETSRGIRKAGWQAPEEWRARMLGRGLKAPRAASGVE